VTRGQGH